MFLQFLLAAIVSGAVAEDMDVSLPERVDVLPVFFVPHGEAFPTREQKLKLARHVKWAQDWYREALGGRDTFRIAKPMPDVYRGKQPFAFYRQLPKKGVTYGSHFVGELLDHYKVNRFNCPYVFAIIFMSPREDFPNGGGQPVNGGLNTGAGVLNMSSFYLDRVPGFQATLRHELGHTFGLLHATSYKYDLYTAPTIMSYNQRYVTKGFQEAPTPTPLMAEDIRALALNKRCFAKLKYDPDRDNPDKKTLLPTGWLWPIEIVGQPDYRIKLTTTCASLHHTVANNLVQVDIWPSTTFNASRMWHSVELSTGWVTFDLTFPVPVTLTKIAIHTQHSGQYHAAERARIEVKDGEDYRKVVEQPIENVDALVSMPPTRGKTWRLHLQAGKSKMIVVRGLRFFDESGEIFPPAIPYSGPPARDSAASVE